MATYTQMRTNIIFKKLFFGVLVIFLARESVAQSQGSLSKNSQINDLLNATFAYTGVALACNDRSYLDLKTRLVQLLDIADAKNDLLPEGKMLSRDLSRLLEAGAKEFKRRPYVSCSEAETYYKQIIDVIDPIIKMNQ
jgi:hypothetical protein